MKIILILLFLVLIFGIWWFFISNKEINTGINTFVYQLQDASFESLYPIDFNLAVIDWEEAALSLSELSKLHDRGKKIITYLSIGEAENYRDYWQDWDENPPEFLEKENPEWKGNYKVKYWHPEWKKVIFGKIDRILEAGYDGVYLDIIDAYSYFEDKGMVSAPKEMIDFVSEISKRAKFKKPDFLIIPQNSPELIEEAGYLGAIDGLGKEDTWYYDNEARSGEELQRELVYLQKAVDAGKFVLVIDYPTDKNKQCDFIRKAKDNNFIPFVSNRALNKIEIINCK